MNQNMKKLVSSMMAVAVMAPSVLIPASAVGFNLGGILDDVFGEGTAKAVGSAEVKAKQTAKAAGLDLPAADANTWGFITWEGQNGAVSYDKLEIAKDQSRFPKHVYFKDNTGGFNDIYEYALVEGTLYLKKKDTSDQWRVAPQPESLKGNLKCMSCDNKSVYLVDNKGWTYGTWAARKDTAEWFWMTAVCGTMETTPMWKLTNSENGQWADSSVSPDYDEFYIDSDGKVTSIGGSGCTDLYYLNPDDNTKIVYCDPWLPGDDSREIASPLHGTFQVKSLSASSSTLFITNEYGDLYTRLFDYDISGGDEIFFTYSYYPQDGKEDNVNSPLNDTLNGSNDPRYAQIRVPAEAWYQQPKIDGTITDRLTIQSLGGDSNNRILRVEGMKNGKTGYFEKMLYDAKWTFHATGQPLKGTILKNSAKDTSANDVTEETGIDYGGYIGGGAWLQVTDFNYAATENQCYITVGSGKNAVTVPVTLVMMYGNLGSATSSQVFPHSKGLTEEARVYNGALMLSDEAYAELQKTDAGQKFLSQYMKNNTIRDLSMNITVNHISIMENRRLQKFVNLGCYQLDRMD